MPHDELIGGRAAGVHAGFDDERTGISKSSFSAMNGVLDEHARCKVAVFRLGRSPQLFLHRAVICVRFTIGFLDHQRDSRSACAHALDPPHGTQGPSDPLHRATWAAGIIKNTWPPDSAQPRKAGAIPS